MSGLAPPGLEPEAPTESSWPPPGGLGIREARSWATWQLVVAVAAGVVIGMIIGYSGKKPSTQTASASHSVLNLGGPSVTTARSGSGSGFRPGLQTSTTRPVTTTTTPGPPTTFAPNARLAVVVPVLQGTGPTQLQNFSVAKAWEIGWAFSCTGAPAGQATFTIQAVPASPSVGPTLTAVQQTSRDGQGLTPESTLGTFHLQITTDPACRWAAKITQLAS